MPIHTFSSFLSGDNVPLRLTQREALETRCALFVMSATASESKFSSLERERRGIMLQEDPSTRQQSGSHSSLQNFQRDVKYAH